MGAPRRAFTFLELLIVILLIAMMMALLLVAIGQARASARRLQCLNNLRQIALGVRLYAETNSGRLPDGLQKPWYLQIAPLMEAQQGIFRCPADPQMAELSYGWRDEAVCIPSASLAGKQIESVAKSELVMVFDAAGDWHALDMVNVAMVSAASQSMTEDEFEDNLLLDANSGGLFFQEGGQP